MNKRNISKGIVLLLILLINMNCQGNSHSKEEQGLIKNSNEMEANIETKIKGCISLDSVSFNGKKELMEYLRRKIEYRDSVAPGAYYEGPNYTDESIRYIFSFVSDKLKKEGYKRPTKDEFNTKMYEYFALTDTSSRFTTNKYKPEYFEYLMYHDGSDTMDSADWLILDGSLIFVPEYQFIYRVLRDPYTEIVKVENDRYYICIPPNIYHYNKFIFNDSKASLTWLLNNDMEFLTLLVCEFGYDKNERINKAVLEKLSDEYYAKQPRERKVVENLFTKIENNGDLDIRTGLMQYIVDNTNDKSEAELGVMLYNFGNYIEYAKIDESLKLEIFSYVGYYIQLIYNKLNIQSYDNGDWYPGSFLRNIVVSKEELIDHIKENNYYDLPNYEEMLQDVLNQWGEDQMFYNATHKIDENNR